MKSNESGTRSTTQPSREGSGSENAGIGGTGRRLWQRIGKRGVLVLSGVFVASVTVAMLHAGCTNQVEEQQAQQSTPSEAVVATHPGAVAVPPQALPQGDESVSQGMDSPETVPPEIAATVSDTLVVPGGVFEITAETSPDVIEVTLRDGVGRMQAFAYDSSSSIWRTYYRAPIKPTERLALSVTGKTGAERWRRVWVFMRVQPESSAVPSASEE